MKGAMSKWKWLSSSTTVQPTIYLIKVTMEDRVKETAAEPLALLSLMVQLDFYSSNLQILLFYPLEPEWSFPQSKVDYIISFYCETQITQNKTKTTYTCKNLLKTNCLLTAKFLKLMCQWSLPRSISSIGEDGNVFSFVGEFLTLFGTFVAFRICCCCCSMRDWTLLLPSALCVKGEGF